MTESVSGADSVKMDKEPEPLSPMCLCLACNQEVSYPPAGITEATTCSGCGEALLIRGQFLVLSHLGVGGSGNTYQVRDYQRERRLALKLLPVHEVQDWRVIELFERQFTILKGLDHHGIPKVFEQFELKIAGRLYLALVQDWVQGSTLQEQIRDGKRTDEKDARRLLGQMLVILEYLHGLSPPVFHRDIKPSNIIIKPDGSPVLIDFGAARGTLAGGDATMVGTAGYVAPEQLAGQASAASDLYGLGMTMAALLSHMDPTQMPVERLRVRFEPYVNVSPDLLAILQQMVAPAVEDRISSAAEVRALLRKKGKKRLPAAKQGMADGGSSREVLASASMWTGPAKVFGANVSERRGKATRLKPRVLEDEGWSADRRLVWPMGAKASSEWRGGWEASTLVGPPRVFPRYGDYSGTWAPARASEGLEWLDLRFPGSIPPAQAIRVFETFNPGGVCAIAVAGPGGGDLEVVWRGGGNRALPEEVVLEVDLSPPRPVERVLVGVDTTAVCGWQEVDTVCLVCQTNARDSEVDWRRFGSTATPLQTGPMLTVLKMAVVVALLLGGLGVCMWGSLDRPPGGGLLGENQKVEAHKALPFADEDIRWASAVVGVSSYWNFQDGNRYRASQVLGAPNVFPNTCGTDPLAWASASSKAGREWISVKFAEEPVSARAIVVIESSNAGAVVAIENPAAQDEEGKVLWRSGGADGERKSYGVGCGVLVVRPKPPVPLTQVRVVLDTTQVDGWNEIDAIGLVVGGAEP